MSDEKKTPLNQKEPESNASRQPHRNPGQNQNSNPANNRHNPQGNKAAQGQRYPQQRRNIPQKPYANNRDNKDNRESRSLPAAPEGSSLEHGGQASPNTSKPQQNRSAGREYPQRRFRESIKSVSVEESLEDIVRDSERIEKEIDLEIKEIAALKFGL